MKKILLLIVFVLFALVTFAQPPKPGEGGEAPDTGNSVNNAPIGTATILMLGLGGLYTGYKLNNKRKY